MGERIEQTASSQCKLSEMAGAIERHNENFLQLGVNAAQRLACLDCRSPELCAAAARPLLKLYPGRIPDRDIDTIEGYGIKVDGDKLCPGRISEEAIRRTEGGEFWLLKNDPLLETSERIQAADAVRNTMSTIIVRLESGQRI